MTEPTEQTKCNICLEKFTGVVRAKVTCPYCPSSTCKVCLQQYLLNLMEDPHCMSCKREWNREFLDMNLPSTFRKGALRLQRRKVLVEREMAMLPSMQVYVEATVERDKAWKKYRESQIRADSLVIERSKQEMKLSRETATIHDSTITPQSEAIISEAGRLWKEHAEENIRSRLYYNHYTRQVAFLEGRETGRQAARQFIMKCPGSSGDGEPCRGFLSSQWKCGTCQKYFCKDCHLLLGERNDGPHTCNEDAKATAAMISKETRPCPKCGIRISKIDGCDQMWCTSCQTAFSWNTGQILHNARIHNPHYYEYLRQSGRTMPREMGDIPCGGLPDFYHFYRTLRTRRDLSNAILEHIQHIHRSLQDISEVRLPTHPLRRPANDNRDLDVTYLIGTITKEEWARHLEIKETKFERKKDIGLILQTLVHVGAEKLTELSNLALTATTINNGDMIRERVRELEELRDFTNKALKERGDQMGIVVPQILGERWEWKYTSRRKATTPIENADAASQVTA